MRILLSSFDPFGPHAVNASAEVARRVAEEGVDGAGVVAVGLPVVRFEAVRQLVEAFERERPDALVMLGIDAKRGEITPERVAVNVDDFRIPDNEGNRPVDEPILPGAPAAYFSTLPIKAVVAALQAAEIPAAVSNSAGTYLCNHVFYGLLHYVEGTGSRARAGFVHIPQMSEAAEEGAPSLPLETLVRGVSIALGEVARAGPR